MAVVGECCPSVCLHSAGRYRSRNAGRRGRYPHGEQQGLFRQVVKQAGGLVEEERQIVLDAGGPASLAHLLIDGTLGPRQLELLAELAAKQFDGRLVGRVFPGGQQADCLDRFAGALGFGIERTDGVHFIVEEVDAIGAATAHGEEIRAGSRGRQIRHVPAPDPPPRNPPLPSGRATVAD